MERRRALAHELKEEGRPQEEIAQILGVSAEEVKEWLSREVQTRASTRPLPSLNWRERRRALSHQLTAEGWRQIEIASMLGVTQGAISQWRRRESVKDRKPTGGPPPRLDEWQKAELARMLAKREKWSQAEMADLIWQKWGVRYHPAHTSRLRQELLGEKHS